MRWWARTRAAPQGCPACEHPWREHAGSGAYDPDGVDGDACGECLYEVEHGEHGDQAVCRLRAYHSRVQALLAAVHDRLAALGPVVWVAPSSRTRTARVDVDLPGTSTSRPPSCPGCAGTWWPGWTW